MSRPTGGLTIRLIRLPHGEGLALPAYQSASASGFDLCAAVRDDTPLLLRPLERALVPSGFAMAIPKGYEGQLRARSSVAFKRGLALVNGVGTIDADYRGEILMAFVNLDRSSALIRRGERLAQLVIAPTVQARIERVSDLETTARGKGGFGSTG